MSCEHTRHDRTRREKETPNTAICYCLDPVSEERKKEKEEKEEEKKERKARKAAADSGSDSVQSKYTVRVAVCGCTNDEYALERCAC